MRNITWIIVFALVSCLMVYNAFQADKKINEKDATIKELEFQVWSLRLDKRLDSIREYHVELFKRKLDSIHRQH